MKTATANDLEKPLSQVFAELENTNDSLLIREDGEAVAALLTGDDYQEYRSWISERAWDMIQATREANAHLDAGEIDNTVDDLVANVRKGQRAARAAS